MEEISGVLITKLKKIRDSRGAVFHGIRKSNEGFHGFGELYFSSVENGVVKGWKKAFKDDHEFNSCLWGNRTNNI